MKSLSIIQKTIYAVLGFLILVASAFGVTKIFVLKPVHDLELKEIDTQLAGVAQSIIQMQTNTKIEKARDDVRYWRKECQDIRRECANNWDTNCTMRYQEAKDELKRAQDRLDKLTGAK